MFASFSLLSRLCRLKHQNPLVSDAQSHENAASAQLCKNVNIIFTLTLISGPCQPTLNTRLVGFLNTTTVGFLNPAPQCPALGIVNFFKRNSTKHRAMPSWILISTVTFLVVAGRGRIHIPGPSTPHGAPA